MTAQHSSPYASKLTRKRNETRNNHITSLQTQPNEEIPQNFRYSQRTDIFDTEPEAKIDRSEIEIRYPKFYRANLSIPGKNNNSIKTTYTKPATLQERQGRHQKVKTAHEGSRIKVISDSLE